MKHALLSLLFVASSILFSAESPPKKDESGTIFRKPFTLSLKVDKEHIYEEKFEKMPYVHKGCVYLFKGDEFGISLQMDGKSVKGVSYQPDIKKANITLKFTQVPEDGEKPMMQLTIKNISKEKIYVDALMTIPGKKGIFKTSILPLEPGLSGFESWPHPVVQLVLKNIRTTEKNQEAQPQR